MIFWLISPLIDSNVTHASEPSQNQVGMTLKFDYVVGKSNPVTFFLRAQLSNQLIWWAIAESWENIFKEFYMIA